MVDLPRGTPLPMLPETLTFAGETSPCVAAGCRLCCMDTQMPLTSGDIDRLETATGRARDTFTVQADRGPPRLANQDGQCVFLGATGCTVYTDRPAGCRLYPLVLDPETHKGVLDEDCPETRAFRIRPRDRAALVGLVHHLDLLDDAV